LDQLSQLVVTGVLGGSLYSLVAVSVVLIYKSTQVVSLAHGQLMAFGALFYWICLSLLGLNPFLGFLLALGATGFLGLIIEQAAIRPLIGQPLFTSFLMTFSLFMVLDGIFQLILKGQSKSFPSIFPSGLLSIGSINVPVSKIFSFVMAVFVFGLLGIFFKYTKIGLGMRATSENHELAQSIGISVKSIFSWIWIISAIVAAIGGIAAANVMDIHYPLPYIIIKGLIVCLLGGLESIVGALVGGICLGIIENVSAGYLDPFVGGGIQEVAAFVVLLIILLVKPYGLFGEVRIERI